jgi:hypothetical protein
MRHRKKRAGHRQGVLDFDCFHRQRVRIVAFVDALPEAWVPFAKLPDRIAGTARAMDRGDIAAKYAALALRRRRAQIAARHELDRPRAVVLSFAR